MSDRHPLIKALIAARKEYPAVQGRSDVKFVALLNNPPEYYKLQIHAENQAFDHGVSDADFQREIPVWDDGIRLVTHEGKTAPEHYIGHLEDKVRELTDENARLVFWVRISGFLAASLLTMRIATWML